jgi:hypothetical protein
MVGPLVEHDVLAAGDVGHPDVGAVDGVDDRADPREVEQAEMIDADAGRAVRPY